MSTHSDKGKHKSHQPNPPHPKGFDPKQTPNAKHPGYDVNPHGKNAKAVRSKIALQHTHKHGRGEG